VFEPRPIADKTCEQFSGGSDILEPVRDREYLRGSLLFVARRGDKEEGALTNHRDPVSADITKRC
jgi:hypothetical protein